MGPAQIEDCLPDDQGRLSWQLVLPETENGPSALLEALAGVQVPLAVAPHFRIPVALVSGRWHVVGRTAVPEAPIDEDGESDSGESDVCPPSMVEGQRKVDSIPQAEAVEDPAEFQLGGSVSSTVRAHYLPR